MAISRIDEIYQEAMDDMAGDFPDVPDVDIHHEALYVAAREALSEGLSKAGVAEWLRRQNGYVPTEFHVKCPRCGHMNEGSACNGCGVDLMDLT